MSLRLRNTLMMIALFAGFGVANAVFYYATLRSELAWGISEQAKGRAISLAAFAGRELHPSLPQFTSTLGRPLRRMGEGADGLNIQWYEDKGKGWVAIPLFEAPKATPPAAPTAQQLETLGKGEAVSHFVSLPAAGADLTIAYAGVSDKDGKLRAVIAISSSDTVLRSETASAQRQCLVYCLVVILLGLLVAEILTRIVRRGISRLEKGASALLEANYRHEWEPSRIAELNDLGNTFKTISEILDEGIRHAWRRFFQAELLPRREEIAADLQVYCDGNAQEHDLGPKLAVRRVNEGCNDDFWGLHAEDKGWTLVAGRLTATDAGADMLGDILRATAARDHLMGALRSGTAAEAWTKIQRAFPCLRGECVESAAVPAQVRCFSFGPGASAAEVAKLENGRGLVGTLDAEALRLAREYLPQFEGKPLEMAADKLASILAPFGQGLLVIYEDKKGSP